MNSTSVIQEIKLKVTKLMQLNEELLNRVHTLEHTNGILKSEIQQQKNTIETLQTQNKIVKLAEILPSTEQGTAELKKELNHYIKQLDDCIRLLSE